jgi:hypothetical protein
VDPGVRGGSGINREAGLAMSGEIDHTGEALRAQIQELLAAGDQKATTDAAFVAVMRGLRGRRANPVIVRRQAREWRVAIVRKMVADWCHSEALASTDELDNLPEPDLLVALDEVPKHYLAGFELLSGTVKCQCGATIRPMTAGEIQAEIEPCEP